MKKISISLYFLFVCAVFAFSLPTKKDIYGIYPNVAKEITRVLNAAYKESSLKNAKSVKQIKANSFDLIFVNDIEPIEEAQYLIDIWGGAIPQISFVQFQRIGDNVVDINILVKNAQTKEDLFSFSLQPKVLYPYFYIPIVINQDKQTSNLWDKEGNTFYMYEGQPYPVSKVEMLTESNDPFTYSGVQLQRDMLDGQGPRNHTLYALKTGTYEIYVEATLANNQIESEYCGNMEITSHLPIIIPEPEDKITIYYNSGEIVIESGLAKEADIKVFDITGKQVAAAKLKGNKTIINMASKAQGIYLIKMKGPDLDISQKIMAK